MYIYYHHRRDRIPSQRTTNKLVPADDAPAALVPAHGDVAVPTCLASCIVDCVNVFSPLTWHNVG